MPTSSDSSPRPERLAPELTPQRVRTARFTSVRKGFDPAEVTEFLLEVAEELARLHNRTLEAERDARSSRERLQALTGVRDVDGPGSESEGAPVERALHMAHRAAEAVRLEAKAEAAQIIAEARAAAVETSGSVAEELRREIDSLVGRREFLLADIEQLDEFLAAQRRRVHSAGRELLAFAENVPLGLGAKQVHAGDREPDPD